MTKKVTIKNQREYDDLPEEFSELTQIKILSEDDRVIKVKTVPKNTLLVTIADSNVQIFNNSEAAVWGKSHVGCFDNSKVSTYGDGVEIFSYDNSRVTAKDRSIIKSYDNSKVSAFDNSEVLAFDNSEVQAFGESTVKCYRDSKITAFGKARVYSEEESKVELHEFSIIENYSENTQIVSYDYSTLNLYSEPKILNKKDTVNVNRHISTPSFKDWVSRGIYLYKFWENGRPKEKRLKILSQQIVKSSTVYRVEEFAEDTYYLTKKGDNVIIKSTVEEIKEELKCSI